MKAERDPLRLLDARSGAPDPVRTALSAGRSEAPASDVLARMAAKLPVGGAPGGSGEPRPPMKPAVIPAAAPSILPGVLVGAALGALVSGGLSLWMPVATTPGLAGTPSTPAVTVTLADSALPQEPARRPRSEEASSSASPGPAAAAVSKPEYNPPQADSPRIDEQASSARPASTPAAAEALSGPGAAVEESESALVQRAQSALASNPGLALALAGQHQARYPGGMFAQEREVIAISALLSLGRRAEAEARAAAFLAANPRSAYRPRVEALAPVSEGEK